MDLTFALISLLLGCLVTHQVMAKRDVELYCGACKALVDEIQFAIGEVDPHKMIEMGFRIDPQGRQKAKKVPYALSEVHLTELMEDICSKLRDYAESKDPETSVREYVRFNARNEQDTVELKNVSINKDISKALEIACQNIVEEHEEEVIAAFKTTEIITKTKICQEIVGICPGADEETQLPEKAEL